MSKNSIWVWSISIIILTIASITMVRQVKSMQIRPLGPEDVAINGIKPSEIVTQAVLQKLGIPKEIQETHDEEGIFREYHYPTFTMVTQIYSSWKNQKNVEVIENFRITTSSFKTARGISVGDDIEKLFEKYGAVKLEGDGYFYEYIPKSDSERGYLMVAKVQGKKIVKILFQ